MKKYMNNSFNINDINKEVELYGWVQKKRDLGGVTFIDLRDRSGIIQIVIRDEDLLNKASSIKNEYVLKVKGIILERENKNKTIDTGDIEVEVKELEILNSSKELPFSIEDNTTALEDLRLKYRYLDLRRPELTNSIITRNKIVHSIRNYFYDEGFIEVETPVLCKSTPEGARDYLVPSRVNKGKFYALPQSPQIFKQLLMVSGFEKYYQIAKCFRDEDLRSDRQPEFTQVDVEMSFVNQDDVMNAAEGMIKKVFKDIKNIDLNTPFMRMKYDDAIEYYGSDKPDLRYDMKINDITDIFKNTEMDFIKNIINNNGIVNAIVAKKSVDEFSRKKIDELSSYLKELNNSSLIYLKFGDELSGSIAKNISDDELKELKKKLDIKKGDVAFIIVGDNYKKVKTAMGALRIKVANILNLVNDNEYALLWVTDFPSFEWSEEEGRYLAMHHPFTSPRLEDVDKLINDKEHCYSIAYDIVINGYEAGGGSIRIHDGNVQKKMFEALELTEEDIKNKFGFFVEALKYGTPPHGGLAFGLDRLTMLLLGTDNIRNVIAFPKTASASDLMSECPNVVDKDQLKILGLEIKEK